MPDVRERETAIVTGGGGGAAVAAIGPIAAIPPPYFDHNPMLNRLGFRSAVLQSLA